MKYFIFCAVAVFVAGEVSANYANFIYSLGTRVTISSRALTCAQSGPQCADDCSTLMICAANNPTPLTTTKCSSPTQYCVGSACTGTPSASCSTDTAFTCTSDGIFPDPENCTQYWECTGETPALFQCPSGFVFDSVNNICAASTARTAAATVPCNKIDCSKKPNGFIVYPGNAAYYAYCALGSTGQITTYMFMCEFPSSQIFDSTAYQCIFNCKAKGNFQDPADCAGYYYCSAAKDTKPVQLTCETGYVFDGVGCNKDAATCKYPPPPPA